MIRRVLAACLVVSSLLGLGGEVTWYEESLPTTLNPLFARTMADERTQELVFDRLFFRTALDGPSSQLLTSMERLYGRNPPTVPLRGTVDAVKIRVRGDIYWHDGHLLTMDDICFTIAAMLDPRTPITASIEPFRRDIAGCELQADTSEAIVRFTHPVVSPADYLGFRVIPRRAFASTAVTEDLPFGADPIGSGPYRASLGPNGVVMEAFAGAHHPANVKSLRVTADGDPAAQLAAVIAGSADGMIVVPPGLRATAAAAEGVSLKSLDLHTWWYFAIDTRRAPWSDRRVRQGLDASLDRQALLAVSLGVDEDDPNLPWDLVSGPFVQASQYYNRSVRTPRADPKLATERLLAAGAVQKDGMWRWRGRKMSIHLGIPAALEVEAPDLLGQVERQLRAAGFDVRTTRLSAEDWERKAVPGGLAGFDMVIGKWWGGLTEDVAPLFHTPKDGAGTHNVFEYSDVETDRLLDAFRMASDDSAARDAYHDLHRHLADDLPVLFLWTLDSKSVWNDRVHNNTLTPYHYFTLFEEWKVPAP